MTTSPSLSEYGVATAAVYTTTPPSGGQELPIIPAGSGLTLIRQSDPALLSDGFSAAAFQDGNGNIIIAYEGTQIQRGTYNVPTAYTVGTGGADYVLGNGGTPQALQDAITFAKEINSDYGSTNNIYVTGHSLGGTEAEAAAQSLGADVIQGGVTFAATGLPGNSSTNQISANLIDYVDYGDPIGNFSSDILSPLSSISPQNMFHYGVVVYTGNITDSADLQDAAGLVQQQLSMSQSGYVPPVSLVLAENLDLRITVTVYLINPRSLTPPALSASGRVCGARACGRARAPDGRSSRRRPADGQSSRPGGAPDRRRLRRTVRTGKPRNRRFAPIAARR